MATKLAMQQLESIKFIHATPGNVLSQTKPLLQWPVSKAMIHTAWAGGITNTRPTGPVLTHNAPNRLSGEEQAAS
ncbi:hypothetical protein GCM10027567_23780 [Spongiibacter taiwanensis]